MDSGYRGFNIPRPPMNMRFGMRPPSFPVYNRSSVYRDVRFAENPEFHGNNFWVGPFELRDPPKSAPPPVKIKKKKKKELPVPMPAPLVKKKKKPRKSRKAKKLKGAAESQQNQNVTTQPQNPEGAAKNPQPIPKVASQPQNPRAKAAKSLQKPMPKNVSQTVNSGGAAKNPQQPLPKVASQPQTSGANASKSLQQPMPKNVSQTVNSGGAAKNPQPIPKVASQLQNPRAKSLQQPMPRYISQTVNSGVSLVDTAKSPQQPNPPGVSQPANVEVKKDHTTTQNGDLKKRQAAEEARDTDVPTQPLKKLKTEEMNLPAELPNIMIDYGWQDDTSTMFSCSLCQYQTHDEQEIQKHFYSYQHREILRHLYVFFPKDRVDFLHEYLLFKKKKMSLERRKDNNQQPIKDSFKGIGPEHYLHRIQAAHCLACNVLLPDVPQLLTKHIRSDGHLKNQKATFRNLKVTSLAAAKELLLDNDILQMLKKYNAGQNPFKDIAVCSPQVSNTHEVLVAEEDDDIVDDTNDEDAITDAGDDQEVSVNHNESPVHENKDSSNKVSLPDEPETMEPDHKETSSMTVNTDGTVKEEETEEEEEEAAEAP